MVRPELFSVVRWLSNCRESEGVFFGDLTRCFAREIFNLMISLTQRTVLFYGTYMVCFNFCS